MNGQQALSQEQTGIGADRVPIARSPGSIQLDPQIWLQSVKTEESDLSQSLAVAIVDLPEDVTVLALALVGFGVLLLLKEIVAGFLQSIGHDLWRAIRRRRG
jgi:hypothetical protein